MSSAPQPLHPPQCRPTRCGTHSGYAVFVQGAETSTIPPDVRIMSLAAQIPILWITGTIVDRRAGAPRGSILASPANHLGNLSWSGLHAFFAPVSRRAARAPSGFGGGGPARQIEESWTGVAGGPAPPQREKGLVLRHPPGKGGGRLLLRQERQHLRLRDDDGGRDLPRGGRAARRPGRHGAAPGLARGGGARRAAAHAL